MYIHTHIEGRKKKLAQPLKSISILLEAQTRSYAKLI